MTDSERLAIIETTLESIKHGLFGNGQPGQLAELDSRITKLENWRWWVVGIAIGLGMASGAGLSKILEAATK